MCDAWGCDNLQDTEGARGWTPHGPGELALHKLPEKSWLTWQVAHPTSMYWQYAKPCPKPQEYQKWDKVAALGELTLGGGTMLEMYGSDDAKLQMTLLATSE